MTTVEHSLANPSSDDGSATVIRSEEQLSVSLPVRVSGGLRVRKVVRTETVIQTVQIRREQLVVDELEVDDLRTGADTDQQSDPGPRQLADQEFEIVLHEERVILSTHIVPVERVRVRTSVLTDQVEVSSLVRREQVEILHPDAPVATDSTNDVT